jgi:hypothetical protein
MPSSSGPFVLVYIFPTLHAILSGPRNIQDAALDYVVLVRILHSHLLNSEQIRQGGSYAGVDNAWGGGVQEEPVVWAKRLK